PFEVDPQRGTDSPGSTEPEDYPAPIRETDANALRAAGRAVHRILVGEVVGIGNAAPPEAAASQLRQLAAQVLDQSRRRSAVDLFIVVPRVIVASVGLPVLADDLVDALPPRRQHVQPQQHRPKAILLAHVVRAGAGALLAADGNPAGIQQIAEVLPAGGGLVPPHREALPPQA